VKDAGGGREPYDLDDIQGLIFSAYSHLQCSTFVLFQVRDAAAARAWIARITPKVTTRYEKERSLNVAFTFDGLKRLGLPDVALATFQRAFVDGMASPTRSRILGDSGDSDPSKWKWGTEGRIGGVLLVYAKDEARLAAELAGHRAGLGDGIEEVLALPSGRQHKDSPEHFGFLDGVGQPTIVGTPQVARQRARTGHATPLKPGEFILGHVNEYGVRAASPWVPPATDVDNALVPWPSPEPRRDLGLNGSYLVFRQFQQDVAGFWGYVDRATRDASGAGRPALRDLLAAKFVGRWKSGAPLVKAWKADDPSLARENDFGYRETDPAGLRCPLGAHIRRSNPRDWLGPSPEAARGTANRHRLLRRGRSYGRRHADPLAGDDGVERGLHFISLNGDIERQFEFVQQTWLNNRVFGGLADERDPIVAVSQGDHEHFTVPSEPVRWRAQGLQDFVTVKGGAYFFLPSRRALRYLAALR
jgi:Dyp-type peroxidase family